MHEALKKKKIVASEALVIEVTEVYKMLHENSIKFKDSDTWLLRTPQDDIMQLSQLADETSAEERKVQSPPHPKHLFQNLRLNSQFQIKLHSCAAFPSHSEFGVWSTFVQQLNRILQYICKSNFFHPAQLRRAVAG